MKFKKLGYEVKRQVVSKEIASLCAEYLLLKRNTARYLYNEHYILPVTKFYGTWHDGQVPGTWAHYGDNLMEILLRDLKPKMEEWTGLKLLETYSYTRIYRGGDELIKHRDRSECKISTTLNLGGDLWPIFLEPNIKINLQPGDMLIYKGDKLSHWRKPFKGNTCVQVFLHYIKNTLKNKKNHLDGRPALALPKFFPVKTWQK